VLVLVLTGAKVGPNPGVEIVSAWSDEWTAPMLKENSFFWAKLQMEKTQQKKTTSADLFAFMRSPCPKLKRRREGYASDIVRHTAASNSERASPDFLQEQLSAISRQQSAKTKGNVKPHR
jgi:hypothetical protein